MEKTIEITLSRTDGSTERRIEKVGDDCELPIRVRDAFYWYLHDGDVINVTEVKQGGEF